MWCLRLSRCIHRKAQLNVAIDVAEAIARSWGGLPRNAVNMVAIPPEVMEKLAPYLSLAESWVISLPKPPAASALQVATAERY